MPRSRRSNALALAVLACLLERPMHPYEMATTMRSRGKHDSIRLNYGSLYTVVQALERAGMIQAGETEREGRRPERTVYTLTDAGRMELVDWLSELLSTPAKEFTQFEAGLSLMPCLHPDDVADLLDERVRGLERALTAERSVLDHLYGQALPRLFGIENEYRIMLREAEVAWVKRLADEIRSGTLEGIPGWLEAHARLEPRDQPKRPRPLREAGGG
jgi:DNA-binding PadR family transcriptional regulator